MKCLIMPPWGMFCFCIFFTCDFVLFTWYPRKCACTVLWSKQSLHRFMFVDDNKSNCYQWYICIIWHIWSADNHNEKKNVTAKISQRKNILITNAIEHKVTRDDGPSFILLWQEPADQVQAWNCALYPGWSSALLVPPSSKHCPNKKHLIELLSDSWWHWL